MSKTFGAFALSLGLLCGFGAAATAQDQPGDTPEAQPEGDREREGRRGRRGGRGMGNMTEQLGLSEEQAQQMDEIRQSMREEMRALREQGGGFDRDAFMEMRQKMEAKMKEILTPDQLKKFEELRSQRGQFGRGRGGGPDGRRGRRGPDMKAEAEKALGLGEEEAAVVMPLVEAVIAARRDIGQTVRQLREDLKKKVEGEPTDETVAAALADFRKAREEAQTRVAKARADLVELLTPLQETKLVALGLLE